MHVVFLKFTKKWKKGAWIMYGGRSDSRGPEEDEPPGRSLGHKFSQEGDHGGLHDAATYTGLQI